MWAKLFNQYDVSKYSSYPSTNGGTYKYCPVSFVAQGLRSIPIEAKPGGRLCMSVWNYQSKLLFMFNSVPHYLFMHSVIKFCVDPFHWPDQTVLLQRADIANIATPITQFCLVWGRWNRFRAPWFHGCSVVLNMVNCANGMRVALPCVSFRQWGLFWTSWWRGHCSRSRSVLLSESLFFFPSFLPPILVCGSHRVFLCVPVPCSSWRKRPVYHETKLKQKPLFFIGSWHPLLLLFFVPSS